MQPTTFARALADESTRSGSRPLVTFYDDATGERVELSVVTYANWVAKTAGLLQDELGLEHGDTLLVDLPTHWLGPVLLGAAWSVGLVVCPGSERPEEAAAVVCGPDSVDRYAAGHAPVLALSLRPLGARFTEPLPAGVVDYGAVVWGQPDAFLALDEPAPEDPAWRSPDREATQRQLLDEAREGPWGGPGTRLLTDLNPCSTAGVATLLAPLLSGGGTVWVRNPDRAAWDDRARAEHATVRAAAQPRS